MVVAKGWETEQGVSVYWVQFQFSEMDAFGRWMVVRVA